MKLVNKVKVKNRMGLHTRPATEIVKMLQSCKSQIFFTYNKQIVNAKSILGILMLAVGQNASITITVEGEDAVNVMDMLVAGFASKFGE